MRSENDGDAVTAMTLEHYPGMTEAELARVEAEARQRWPLQASLIVHRVGALKPGDNIVLVVTASAHREAAFAAAEFLMDYLKTRAPFWKKETRADGGARWVDARDSDDAAAGRWTDAPNRTSETGRLRTSTLGNRTNQRQCPGGMSFTRRGTCRRGPPRRRPTAKHRTQAPQIRCRGEGSCRRTGRRSASRATRPPPSSSCR